MSSPSPPHFDRPNGGLVRLWSVVAGLLVILALVAALMAGSALLSSQPTQVDPSQLPAGTDVTVVEGTDGTAVTQVNCPGLLGGPRPSWCTKAKETSRWMFGAGLVVGLFLGSAAYLAALHAWRLRRGRQGHTSVRSVADNHDSGSERLDPAPGNPNAAAMANALRLHHSQLRRDDPAAYQRLRISYIAMLLVCVVVVGLALVISAL